MKCNKIKRSLNPYADREIIDKEIIALIEEHLHICPECRDELNSIILTKDIILQKERMEAGPNFLVNLRNRIDEASEVMNLGWIIEAGNLAKRLVTVPVAMMVLFVVLTFTIPQERINSIDEYLFADLSDSEINILSGSYSFYDLLTDSILNDLKG